MKRMTRFIAIVLSVMFCLSVLVGCQAEPQASQTPSMIELATTQSSGDSIADAETLSAETISAETPSAETVLAETDLSESESIEEESAAYLDPEGSYNSADEVALYIHLYGKLPSNYITKKAAQKLGWSGGSLENFAPGKSIGGSTFGNNEGILPDGRYHECDIDTLGKKKRGAKRIVYSEDGDIYYTEDHYETFTLLYTAEGRVTEEIIYGK